MNTVQEISVQALPFVFAVTLHEAAHAWVAYRCGDSTAKKAGRVSLNPIVHVDPIGTVAIPLMLKLLQSNFLFGYAKPVPVNFAGLNNPKRDMALVALAGPGTNMILAIISAVLYKAIIYSFYFFQVQSEVVTLISPIIFMLRFSVFINVFLCFLNLIPILPLDGGRILVGLLPDQYSDIISATEKYGFMILMLLFIFDPLNIMGGVFHPMVNFFALFFLG